MSVCCTAGLIFPLFVIIRAMDGRIMHLSIIRSCQSSATSEIVVLTRFYTVTQCLIGENLKLTKRSPLRLQSLILF